MGAGYAEQVRTALEHHLRPTTLILRTQPHDPWDEYDFLLLEAHSLLQAERCSQCGLPRYLCHNEDRSLEWRIMEDSCQATVERDRYEKSQAAGKKDYVAPVGTTLRPVPYLADGGDPVSLRESFYEAERLKAEQLRADEASAGDGDDY